MNEHHGPGTPTEFGDWLRLLRARIGQRRGHKLYSPHPSDAFSQRDLARKLGITRATIQRWETNMPLDCHLRRCKPFEVPTYPMPFWRRVLNVLAQDYGMPPMPPRPTRPIDRLPLNYQNAETRGDAERVRE